MKTIDYDNVDDIGVLRRAAEYWQRMANDLNNEVKEIRQREMICRKRIRKMSQLFHLRLSELIEETKNE